MTPIPLSWSLVLAGVLFCIGLYAVLARRTAVGVLMGLALMLNAVLINLVAFWRHAEHGGGSGQILASSVPFIVGAHVVIGLALAVALWRTHSTAVLDDVDSLEG